VKLGRVRFGPAGFPLSGIKGEAAIVYLKEKGLDAMEYQAVRRLPTKREPLQKIGSTAVENDVKLSLHAPYAINLCSEDETKLLASRERLLNACRVAKWLKADHVTFHPGYYGKLSHKEAYKRVKESLEWVIERLEAEQIRVEVSPETTGKPSQFGTLEEVVNLSVELDYVVPTVDFAHLHAREGGIIKGKEDYERILSYIEDKIGNAVKTLLIHFSEIEMTKKGYGEWRHHDIGSGYGPDFKPLAEIIYEWDLSPTIICETPLLDEDAVKLKRIYLNIARH